MKRKKIDYNESSTEAQIQTAILRWAGYMNIQCERANVIGTPITRKDGSKGFRKAPNVGMSDLIMSLVVDGRPICVWVEVKKAGGRISKGQVEFKRRTLELGGEYHIVKSITDIENLVLKMKEKYGTTKPSG